MRILVVTQYFWPENFRVNDLALGLKENGHDVTVLTGIPNYPEGKYYTGYNLFGPRCELYNGIPIFRVPLIARGKSKGLRLVLNYFSFAFFACLLGPVYCRGKFDRIFVFETSPVSVAFPAILLKWIKGCPLYFWILDLWPDNLSATGAVRSPSVLSLVGRMVRWIYAQCDRILISSKGFARQVVEYGYPPERILYLPNWAEDEYWRKSTRAVCPQLPEGFRVVFAGNIGAAQGLDCLVAAAAILRSHADIQWIVIGDGRDAERLTGEVQAKGLAGNVHFLGRHAPEVVVKCFESADALLVMLRPEPAFALTVPGKIPSYLACAKPVIASLDGEGAAVIAEAGAGYACPAGDAEALAAAVLRLKAIARDERIAMGRRGYEYCLNNFNRERLLRQLSVWLTEDKEV